MKITVLGLNHKSAPVEIREKLAFDAADTLRALRQLKDRFREAEFVLLSTCNRVELYSAYEARALGEGLAEDMGPDVAETIADFCVVMKNIDGIPYIKVTKVSNAGWVPYISTYNRIEIAEDFI